MADSKPKLVIVYGTGTNNTRAVAEGILEGAQEEGVDTVLLNVADLQKEEIIAELESAQGIAIGSPTYNRKPIPAIVTLAEMLKDVDMEGIGLRNLWSLWAQRRSSKDAQAGTERLQHGTDGGSADPRKTIRFHAG